MAEVSIEQLESQVRENSWFLEEENPVEFIYPRFTEETTELLEYEADPTKLTKVLWGRQVESKDFESIKKHFKSEGGDVLFHLVAGGVLRNISLRDSMERGLYRYTNEDIANPEEITFTSFDSAFQDRMEVAVPEGYQPDYFGMQFWNLEPYEPPERTQLINDKDLRAPLVFWADGRYVLERTLRATVDTIGLPSGVYDDSDLFLDAAGLALGALSAVGQNRFGLHLSDLAQSYLDKMERRKANKTLREGADIERSRSPDEARPDWSGFESTLINTVTVELPS